MVKDRVSYLLKLAAGLEVLDAGCTGKKADGQAPNAAATLHQALKPVCKTLVGVDSDEDGIRLMAHTGLQVICDDITTMDLERTLDLVIAGEVIEHLPNPCLALKIWVNI